MAWGAGKQKICLVDELPEIMECGLFTHYSSWANSVHTFFDFFLHDKNILHLMC